MRRHVLFVLGMHRSGTSALTGALAKYGAQPGRSLMPATADNPEGYWEDAPLVGLDDALLRALGLRWDSLPPPPSGWRALPIVRRFAADAVKLVADEWGQARFAVVKDPRLCRLLPLWVDAFTAAGYEASCVLMARRPQEVAASLARRDQFAPEKSLALWCAHLVEAERDSRGLPRAFVAYDRLLAEPAATLDQLCRNASFPLQPGAGERAAALALIRPDLKRQRAGAAPAAMVSGLDRALDAGYAALAALAPGADPRAAIEALARDAAPALAAALPPWAAQALADAHGVARTLSAELDSAQQSNATLALQVDEARSAHAARDEAERALRERIDALAVTRSDLAELKTAMQGEMALLSTALSDAQSNASNATASERDLRAQALRAQRDLVDERATIARLVGELDAARQRTSAQAAEIDAARGNIEALVGEIDAARSAHAARDEREAQLAAEIESLAAATEGLHAECETLRAERDTAESRCATLDAELQGARAGLASRERENADLAEANGRAQEALRSLSGELERRAAAEKLLIADRDRLVVLEREARDRIATIEGELTEVKGLAHSLGERLAAASGELERLEARWLGRLARRFARP
jgi:hypothetical protein